MLPIKERAKNDSFAALRLMNLQQIALAAKKANDVQLLLEFTFEGLPLAAYLPQ